MLESEFKKAKYAILVARYGGLEFFFKEIVRRIYRQTCSIGLEKDLNEPDIDVPAKIKYTLHLATPQDFDEIFRAIKTEGKDSTLYLLERKWFYDIGFRNCYIARAVDTNELCYMQWTISLKDERPDNSILNLSFNFPRLGEKDMQLENAYTFVKYRGNKIMPSVMNQLFQIAMLKGFKRVITYVTADNISSLKGCTSVGFREFERIHRRIFLFYSRRWIISTRQTRIPEPLVHDIRSPVL
jgi:hypothetical protein